MRLLAARTLLFAGTSLALTRLDGRSYALLPRETSPDMTCGSTGAGSNNNYTCPSGLCCSQAGWCGSTTDYCGDGCQSAFGSTCDGDTNTGTVSPDMTCGNTGAGTDGYICPDGLCCSEAGWCGNTTDYCGTGCQSSFGAACVDDNSGTVTVSPDMTCGNTGAGTNGYTCPDGLCCSQAGWCGNTTDYCGTGCQSTFGASCTVDTSTGTGSNDRCGPDNGNQVCASNECCSAAGYCGTTEDYCRAPDCLFNYGPACDANQVPSGLNTSTIERTQTGSVSYGGDGIYSCVNEGDMALTFDDGPANYTSHILDLLKAYNASATFMITGNNNGKGQIDDTSLAWPDLIKRMYNEGHQVASHTWSHADLCNITSAQRKNEMWKNEMALRNILGFFPTYMRPPYSSCTAACGCEADMAELGYHVVYFDLDTQDYLNDDPTLIQNSKNIFDQALAGKTAATDDELVIAHDIHQQTAYNLTEYMLQGLLAKGYNPVTVGECLGDPSENWYRIDSRTTLGTKRSEDSN